MVLAAPASPLSGFRLVALPGSMILPSKVASLGGPPLGDWLHQKHLVETSLNWFVRGKFTEGVGGTTCTGTLEPLHHHQEVS